MNKNIFFLVFLMLVFAAPSFAATYPEKVTVWNKITDFFATVGRSDQKKKEIIKERRQSRSEERVFKSRLQETKDTQKKIKKQNAIIMNKIHKRDIPHGRGGIDAPKK